MKAGTLTPQNLFGHSIRYVVPLFQRPYVWNKVDQWAPLWEDVRNLTERLMAQPRSTEVPPHFLGAIVLDQAPAIAGFIQVRHVVDGQQRLTTLQLLLDATQLVVERHGDPADANALGMLVLNQSAVALDPVEVYKVWPTDRDQEAFRQTMDNGTTIAKHLTDEPIPLAHQFFVDSITDWCGADTLDAAEVRQRLHALTMALYAHLKLVVIDLEQGDNAQVIFETLNHRGSPLLAADLIKNLVFQRVLAQGLDPLPPYQEHWKDLDGKYWRTKVARGRQYLPRIDIFANYWLVMRLASEVPSDRIFAEFRDRVATDDADMSEILAGLSADARIYQSWEALPSGSVPELFRYRVLEAMDSGVVTPIFLWLTRWPDADLPAAQRDKALRAIESWVVRRGLCRLTSKDFNRVLLDLLQELKQGDVAHAGDVTESFLLRQTADSRLWPTDEMVRSALSKEPIYQSQLRARLRMVLESVEDSLRSGLSEELSCPRGLTVEHLMPQAWREHWNVDQLDELSALGRDSLIQTLGNLTLVNAKLNPTLSNHPWTAEAAQARGLSGSKDLLGNVAYGKVAKIRANSKLSMNVVIAQSHPNAWTEDDIRARTQAMIKLILDVWTRPRAQLPDTPVVVEQLLPETPAATVDFGLLTEWLRDQSGDPPPMTFSDIEDVLGAELPAAARSHREFWGDGSDLGTALSAAGFKATGLQLDEERVVLAKR